jgi:hypothetical protein
LEGALECCVGKAGKVSSGSAFYPIAWVIVRKSNNRTGAIFLQKITHL